jgi:hypothetical protein
MKNRKRIVFSALLLALVAAVVAVPGIQLASGGIERLANGGFEDGFYSTPVGFVGNGWRWFDNDGRVEYGFYDETWAPVVASGKHSQMIEVNTFGQGGSEGDRYAGIYQTVAVVPGETYDLALQGMLRAMDDDPDRSGYNYRIEIGVDYGGGTDWTAVSNWIEMPWNTVYPRLSPGAMDSYSTTVKASGERLTLFIRAWKKWGSTDRELDVNLDAISLKGATPTGAAGPDVSLDAPSFPVVSRSYTLPVKASSELGIISLGFYDDGTLLHTVGLDVGMLTLAHTFSWMPKTAGSHTLKVVAEDAAGKTGSRQVTVTVGQDGQFLTNGDFETGFEPVPLGWVGTGWNWFYNDARTTYGFYDDTWPPVVYEGKHSQMIEINTKDWGAADAGRYAGIYQTVNGLTKGATYDLSLYGMLRVLSNDTDRLGYNYRVEWGYDPAGGTDWTAVDNWVEIPWNAIYARLDPGAMSSYAASFEAPSSNITIFFRVWKKWSTLGRELDVNMDSISLTGFK